MVEIIISFRGLDADYGHLDALSGIESAVGVARALTIIGHYASTGYVRHRFPFESGVNFYLEGTEEGSFNWKLRATIVGPLALGLAANGLYDLGKLVMSRAIGLEPKALSEQVATIDRTRAGDINALVEAVEPALKKAHYGIGQTANEIVIEETTTHRSIVRFDHHSKEYLSANIPTHDDVQDVSVSALNVNDRTGRVYFLDLHRTIPFSVSRDADPKTISVLSSGLRRYANNNPAPTRIIFSRIEATDGRLKRIVILKAQDADDDA